MQRAFVPVYKKTFCSDNLKIRGLWQTKGVTKKCDGQTQSYKCPFRCLDNNFENNLLELLPPVTQIIILQIIAQFCLTVQTGTLLYI